VTHDPPHDVPVLTITETDIQLQGAHVMTVEEAEKTSGNILSTLEAQLEGVPLVKAEGTEVAGDTRGEINIMADKELPYSLVKKLMATCGSAKFAQISLSVEHHASGMGAP
jgi:biopolymer transport protein ExbD